MAAKISRFAAAQSNSRLTDRKYQPTFEALSA